MKINKIYTYGIFIILALPLLNMLPWFAPPDFGKTMVFRIILAILLFLLAFQFFNKPAYKEKTINQRFNVPNLKNNKIIWILLALLAFFLLSSIFSVDPHFSFWGNPIRAGGFINYVFYVIFAIFIFAFAKDHEWKKFFDFSIFIGGLVSLVAIFQYYGLFRDLFLYSPTRPPSTIGNPIFLGIYLLMLIFLSITFFIKEEKINYKWFYGCSTALFLYVILISGSRAAYLGLIAGLIFFLLSYPKKIRALKIGTLIIILLGSGVLYYLNTASQFPTFLEENKLFKSIQPRLSVKLLSEDERFPAWKIGFNAFLEKPVLGWGLENYAVGFNKYYDPNLVQNKWWDKAHNIFLEIANTAGLPTLITYLILFVFLFYKLFKIQPAPNTDNKIIIHGLQATLVAYLIANFFSIDSFSSHLLFFLFIGYSMHLIYQNNNNTPSDAPTIFKHITQYKKIGTGAIIILLAWFLWQYNFVPIQVNSQINIAQGKVNAKKCDQATLIMEDAIKKESFLNSYVRLRYIDFIGECSNEYPENSLTYAKRGMEIEKELVKLQPLYVRSWLYLGQFTSIVANNEKDPKVKEEMLLESYSYLNQALKLAPYHMEILTEQSRADLIAGDWQKMKESATQCSLLYPDLGACYWLRTLAKIHLKDFSGAKEDMQLASDKNFAIDSALSLSQLVNAYLDVENYEELVMVYKKLIAIDNTVVQNHSSLAVVYANLGKYKEAKEEALVVLHLLPEKKADIEAFLKTLPQ